MLWVTFSKYVLLMLNILPSPHFDVSVLFSWYFCYSFLHQNSPSGIIFFLPEVHTLESPLEGFICWFHFYLSENIIIFPPFLPCIFTSYIILDIHILQQHCIQVTHCCRWKLINQPACFFMTGLCLLSRYFKILSYSSIFLHFLKI